MNPRRSLTATDFNGGDRSPCSEKKIAGEKIKYRSFMAYCMTRIIAATLSRDWFVASSWREKNTDTLKKNIFQAFDRRV